MGLTWLLLEKFSASEIGPEAGFVKLWIENDKVGGFSIMQSFHKHEDWTKALKHMLCKLKWACYWFVGNTNFQPVSAMVSLPSEVPTTGSLYAKRVCVVLQDLTTQIFTTTLSSLKYLGYISCLKFHSRECKGSFQACFPPYD